MESKHLAVLLAVLGLVSVMFMSQKVAGPTEFQSWKLKHGIKYDSLFEQAYRERVFLENLAEIKAHNANEFKTYTKGVNQFTGMTQQEFEQNYLGLVIPQNKVIINAVEADYVTQDLDWVSKGAVTAVKNQGSCGSCWAFSATGGLEGLSKQSGGTLQSFSEQELVDCSGKYGNMACNGGLMVSAFRYVIDQGIVHQDQYAYKAVLQTCTRDSKTAGFKISGIKEISNCNDLTKAISQRVVSVAVDASRWSQYRSGVFKDCGSSLNHGVTLVGISSGNWVIKNSWGTGWGEQGFITLAAGNTCGVCNMASYPTK